MPVTAKLSRQFYERLGDDVANELVEWFNQVDATYRNELRDRAGLVWYRRAFMSRYLVLVGVLAGYIALTFLFLREAHGWSPAAKDRFLVGFASGLVAIVAHTIGPSGRFRRAHDV